ADASPITPKTRTTCDPPAAVEVRGVTFGYGQADTDPAALTDISAALRPGRLTAVLGPNASGKSTLLRVMLGQLRPWAGAVEVAGRPVASLTGQPLARRVSYVPQRGGMSFAFSVRQTVAMGRFAFGDEGNVDEAIDKLGLTDVADRPFNELSGGQQQRVLIARAWAQSQPAAGRGGADEDEAPRVVLADEPASSLDLRHAHGAMALFREMAEEGRAVLVVLHGLDLATRWADEVWLLDRGRLVAQGSADEVLRPEVLSPVYGLELDRLEHRGQTVLVAQPPPGASSRDTLNV
ncbi:MAG: ABC transporter ATP-binding protein, partial [Actinomycetota bacterium]